MRCLTGISSAKMRWTVSTYRNTPSVLTSPIKGELMVLYIVAQDHSLDAFLAQENVEGKDNAFYYLSQTLIGSEKRYYIKKVCSTYIHHQKLHHFL